MLAQSARECSEETNLVEYTYSLQHALQRTATHCNTLQHTATHCNTLQHTATHCNTLQHTATIDTCLQEHNVSAHDFGSRLQCITVCCSVNRVWNHHVAVQDFRGCRRLQYVAICCSVLQCVAVCCSVFHCVALCVAVRCSVKNV